MSGDSKPESLDLSSVRERLSGTTGKEYWRSLEELSETQGFQDLLDREFPQGATEFLDPVSRRNFMKVMGASMALAGIGACTRQPEEKIVPYVKTPEQFVPGRPLFFATAMQHDGYGIGLLAESHLGRPTKLEGNPNHPSSLGATDIFAQASILGLYDPDRSQTVVTRGEISTFDAFVASLTDTVNGWKGTRGSGLRILTETVTSPTVATQLQQLLATYPGARWYQYEPSSRDNVREGARLAFGSYLDTIYRFDRANVIVSLDADFLNSMPGSVRYAREFADGRRVSSGKKSMNRLYMAESTPTLAGAMADHRRAVRPSEVEELARQIAGALGMAAGATGSPDKWVTALVRDLQANRGASIVVAGEAQPPAVHVLAHAINQALGNVGTTVINIDPVEARPANQMAELAELAREMEAGTVDTLIILDANPVFTAPSDLQFGKKMDKVRMRVHFGLYQDETARICHWHVPAAHYLESWGDVRAYDGTASIMQPLIAPLYGGKTAAEFIAALNGGGSSSAYDLVRAYWSGNTVATSATTGETAAANAPAEGTSAQPGASTTAGGANSAGAGTGGTASIVGAAATTATAAGSAPRAFRAPVLRMAGGFDAAWQKALFDGFVANTSSPVRSVAVAGIPAPTGAAAPQAGSFDIVLRRDPNILDGRYANIGWLQELPRPLTKLVWDNAALVSPAAARQLGVENGAMITISRGADRSLQIPVWITPGHPEGSITVHYGNGRLRAGKVGTNVGFNGYVLRTTDALWAITGAQVSPAGDEHELVTTQTHHSMEGRRIVREATLAEFLKDPEFAKDAVAEHEPEHKGPDGHGGTEGHGAVAGAEAGTGGHGTLPSFYPEYEYTGYKWGMAIDLNTCIGCNACTIACQAENNIPVVGKEMVGRSREMHWIRVDRYYNGAEGNPDTVFQPMPCMHCEKAPCEPVCPVGATVHSDEGLNEMVYNRCVGTRYCSNNCPYKVRRFNYLLFTDEVTPTLKLMRNPDVSVRSRGVMEKCTYCVQRINHARIEAKKEFRKIRDGEILTACQQVCPTESISFGDLNDASSVVAKLKASPLNYGLLAADLGTQPRTSYLGKLRNPNPELEGAA